MPLGSCGCVLRFVKYLKMWESRIPRHIQITSGVIYVLLRLTLMPVLQGGLHQQPSQNNSGALKKKTWRALRLFSQSQSPVSGIAEYFFTSKKKWLWHQDQHPSSPQLKVHSVLFTNRISKSLDWLWQSPGASFRIRSIRNLLNYREGLLLVPG